MKQVSEKELEVNGVKLCYETSIKKIIEYEDFFLVLLRERKEIPNNVIAYDYSGKEIWRINDIVKAKIPRGYYDIEKLSDHVLRASYELGIVYEIDYMTRSVIKETYMR